MDPAHYFASSRLVIVAGKGGVGKTTVTAAMALSAARLGLNTLVIEVEGKSGLGTMFGKGQLRYDETLLSAGGGPDGQAEVQARTLTPDDALLDYLEGHGMSRLSRRLVQSGALDMVATATPGIRDVLVLGKVRQLERSMADDLIILDAPAAGHAITFLQSARGLVDAVKVGPIHSQASEVLDLLTDPARCSVTLVTLPEETPVNELVETAYTLEDRVGVSLGPVVVNGLYPPLPGLDVDPEQAAAEAGATLRSGEAERLRAAADFRRQRTDLQNEQMERLSKELPLPQIRLPFLFTTAIGPDDLHGLSDAFLAALGDLPDRQAA